jgi:ribonuclease P protein subunit POP4
MITPKNIIKHELIGLEVEVVASRNPNHIGIKGLVVNETKNMLWIETPKGIKKIPKKYTVFMFTLPNGKKVKVNGNVIARRPEDRIRTKVRKW